MINQISDGISKTLKANFKDCKIYSEEVEQGLDVPCFYISHVRSEKKRLIGNRSILKNLFVVQYFPEKSNCKNEGLQRMSSILYVVLDKITMVNGDQLNGYEMEHEIEDGVLNFFVEFRPIVTYGTIVDETMQEMEYDTNVEDD